MSLANLLPPPMHSRVEEDEASGSEDDALESMIPKAPRSTSHIPPYGKRKGWTPRKPEDFGDGGAYPEVHVAQFPLGMGQKGGSGSSSTLALSLDSEGHVRYDAILRQGAGKDKIIHSTVSALMPVAINSKEDEERRIKPSEEAVEETKARTELALQAIVDKTMAKQQVTHVAKTSQEATYIRYTPANQSEAHNSGASQRIIRLVERQQDPMEPPRFKTNKKVERGPPSPPAPVLHSPPRKVTVDEQNDWKIPPSISNWKNSRGFTIPLDKRMAADGRNLQVPVVNGNFAKFSEALFIAERRSREDIKLRQEIASIAALKEKERKEESLHNLAKKAREERRGFKVDSDEEEEVRERDEIRGERQRDRQRDRNIARAAPEKRNRLQRDDDRDVSERVALGLPAPSGGKGEYDSRLFNQSMGMSSGFGDDDAYAVYDKAFRGEQATSIYRPTKATDEHDEGEYERIKSTDRFRADKGFSGTDGGGSRASGPVQFEKDDDLGLNDFLAEANAGGKKRGGDEDHGSRGDQKKKR